MCMVDYADDWTSLRDEHPKARKQHVCGECWRTIEPGERYFLNVGVADGQMYRSKMCAHCEAAASWLSHTCSGYLFGGVREDLIEHWQESWDLRSLWLGRAIVGMNCRWRRRDGSLMDPPPLFPAASSAAARSEGAQP